MVLSARDINTKRYTDITSAILIIMDVRLWFIAVIVVPLWQVREDFARVAVISST
jgi:hypothetical protein